MERNFSIKSIIRNLATKILPTKIITKKKDVPNKPITPIPTNNLIEKSTTTISVAYKSEKSHAEISTEIPSISSDSASTKSNGTREIALNHKNPNNNTKIPP